MNKFIEYISRPEIFTVIIGIFGVFLGSYLTFIFGIKRLIEERIFQNKLDRYLIIVDKCKGWIEGSDPKISPKDREKFVNSYRTVWLYGHSRVIKELSKFLKIVTNPPKDKEEIEKAKEKAKNILKKAIIEMRKDLKANGKLQEDDFDIFI